MKNYAIVITVMRKHSRASHEVGVDTLPEAYKKMRALQAQFAGDSYRLYIWDNKRLKMLAYIVGQTPIQRQVSRDMMQRGRYDLAYY